MCAQICFFKYRVRDYFSWFQGCFYVSHDSCVWKHCFSALYFEVLTIFSVAKVAFMHHITRACENAIFFFEQVEFVTIFHGVKGALCLI